MTFIPNEADAGIDGEQSELDSVDLDVILDGFRLRGVKTGCAVTAGSNLDSIVAAGTILYDGATVVVAGGTLSHAAAGSQLRFDLVVADSSGTLSIINGTAFYSATYGPSLPTYSNKVVLAVVTIPANATTLSSLNITDHRVVIGTVDHGGLSGLSDDDHTQYVLRSILTTNGDLFVRLAGVVDRLAVGAASTVLGISGGLPAWVAQSYIDHGSLTGLSDDDHTQYALLAGRAGGQVLRGGTAASEDITLESTAHATKGDIILLDQVIVGNNLLTTDDAFKLGIVAADQPALYFGSNDYISFDRTNEEMLFVVNGVEKMQIPTTNNVIFGNGWLTTQDQFYLGRNSATRPQVNFDSGDWLFYDRTSNFFEWDIGSAAVAQLDAAGHRVSGYGRYGSTTAPTDTGAGVLYVDDRLYIGNADLTTDELFYLDASSATAPRMTFDSGDYLEYDRTNNAASFYIDSNAVLTMRGFNNTNEAFQVTAQRNDTSATGAKQVFGYTVTITGDGGGDFRIFVAEPVFTGGGAGNLGSGGIAVGRFGTRWRSSGGSAVGNILGFLMQGLILDASSVNFGTIASVQGAQFRGVSRITANPTGTVSAATALIIGDSNSGLYTLTSQIGLDIEALVKGATNIGIRNASNMRQTGYMSLHGATTTPASTTDGYFQAPFFIIGQNQAPISGTAFLAQPEDLAPSAADGIGAQFWYERSAGAGGLGGLTTLASEMFDSTSSGTQTGAMIGLFGKATKLAASTSTLLVGVRATGRIDAGTITSLNVFDAPGNTYSGGAVTTVRGLNIANLGNAIVGTAVAIDITAQSGAASNFGIRNDSNLVQSGYARFGAVTAPTNTASGVVYVDERLYVGNNGLTTDELFYLGAISAGGPGITFDTNDYFAYDRADDAFVFAIASTEIMKVEDFGIEFQTTQRIDFVANTSGTNVFRVFQSGDTQPRFAIRGEAGAAAAALYWGAGGASAVDVAMYRSAADVLRLDDSFTIAGYLRVGSNTAPTNNTAGDLTLTRLTVGSDAAFSNAAGLFAKFVGTFTNTASGAVAGFNFGPTISPATDSSSEFRILNMSALVSTSDVAVGTVTTFQSEIDYRALNPGATGDVTGLLQTVNVTPVVLRSTNDARQAVTTARGIYINPYSRPSGTGTVSITNLYALLIDGPTSAGATVTSHWGISLVNPGASYAPTTMYGIDIEKFTRATTNIEFRNAGKMVHTPTAQTLAAVTDTIGNSARIIELSNSTGASLTLTSAPTISTTGAQDGQIITLVNDDSADNIVLQDESALANSQLRLPGAANLTLGPRDSATFYFNAGAGEWYCIASTNL